LSCTAIVVPHSLDKRFHRGPTVRYSWSSHSSSPRVQGACTQFAMKNDFMASRSVTSKSRFEIDSPSLAMQSSDLGVNPWQSLSIYEWGINDEVLAANRCTVRVVFASPSFSALPREFRWERSPGNSWASPQSRPIGPRAISSSNWRYGPVHRPAGRSSQVAHTSGQAVQ
jgi:hypothetical protein